jgi:hypothetical protein
MEQPNSIKKALVLQCLVESHGVVTMACNNADVGRTTFYAWMNEDSEFKKEVEDITEQAIDYVESKLYLLIENQDTAATLFYLKTKGRKRGYQERIEETNTDRNIIINISTDKPNETD